MKAASLIEVDFKVPTLGSFGEVNNIGDRDCGGVWQEAGGNADGERRLSIEDGLVDLVVDCFAFKLDNSDPCMELPG